MLAAFSGAARTPLKNFLFFWDKELSSAGKPGKNPIRERTRKREPQICV